MGILYDILVPDSQKEKKNTYQSLIAFGIAVDKITNLIYKECQIKIKSGIKFETAIFLYYRLVHFSRIMFSYHYYDFLFSAARDHIATIGNYRDEHFDKRLAIYNANPHNKYTYEHNTYAYESFSRLISRAVEYFGEWDYVYCSDNTKWKKMLYWGHFLEIDYKNKPEKQLAFLPEKREKIFEIIRNMIEFAQSPFRKAERY
jgi:hypothetical protein